MTTFEEGRAKLRPGPFSILNQTLSLPITSVRLNRDWSFYGSFKSLKECQEAATFVAANTDASQLDFTKFLQSFIDITSSDYVTEKASQSDVTGGSSLPEAAWLTIRLTKPTTEYTIHPRWHRDGRMYTSDKEGDVNSKYAITLLGNPTRLLHNSPLANKVLLEEHEALWAHHEDNATEAFEEAEERSRVRIAERLAEEPIVQLPRYAIIRFSWGQADSAIHSEPDMNTDRMFVSILYGSEKELKVMCEWRNEEYRQ